MHHAGIVCCLLVACLLSQQHACESQGRICSDHFSCCHTKTEVADQTFYLTQSQYTDTGSSSPSADPIAPGAWQGSHWNANFKINGMTRPRNIPMARVGIKSWICHSWGDRLNHKVKEAVTWVTPWLPTFEVNGMNLPGIKHAFCTWSRCLYLRLTRQSDTVHIQDMKEQLSHLF